MSQTVCDRTHLILIEKLNSTYYVKFIQELTTTAFVKLIYISHGFLDKKANTGMVFLFS